MHQSALQNLQVDNQVGMISLVCKRCRMLTLSRLQPRFGDKPLKSQVVCPQNRTAVLKWLIQSYQVHAVFASRFGALWIYRSFFARLSRYLHVVCVGYRVVSFDISHISKRVLTLHTLASPIFLMQILNENFAVSNIEIVSNTYDRGFFCSSVLHRARYPSTSNTIDLQQKYSSTSIDLSVDRTLPLQPSTRTTNHTNHASTVVPSC